MLIITVHDKIAGTWTNPVVSNNAESAKRDFLTACSTEGSMLHQHPDDFELFAIGEWTVPFDDTKVPTISVFDNFKFLMQGHKNES